MRATAALHGLDGWAKAWSRRLSLRARLLLGLVLIAAVGLVVADVVIYGQVESYLTSQVDEQVATSLYPFIRQVDQQLSGSPGFFLGSGGSIDFRQDTPRGAYGAIVTNAGKIYLPTFPDPVGPRPDLPARLVSLATSSTEQTDGLPSRHFTVAANGDPNLQYRLVAVPLDTSPASVAVVALPLDAADAVLHHLVGIDIVASTAVLLLLALLGYAVVRVGMRPLEEIGETAGAIAAGDLSRRVARDEQETEVGRLGASLNAMLGQIEHAFDEQQASEHRLRQFLADASHELRTPVTSIRGYAELFRWGAAGRPEDLERAMRRIEDEAIRMGLLVEDLLLLARLDEGRPLDYGSVDLVGVAADAAADAQVVAPARTITLDAPVPVVVSGDEQRLRQVAMNLVQNALRHTPAGTPVTVSVSADATHAVLSVQDEGQGMAPEHASRVFERFYRADPSRTRESGGTGLGLSIVKSIAEAHGGRAWVETAPGEGARFSVELPRSARGGDLPFRGSELPEEGARPDLVLARPVPAAVEPFEVGSVVEPPQGPALSGDDER